MDWWVLWLVVAGVLVVGELFTLDTTAGLLGASAAVTAGAAFLGLAFPLQLILFAVTGALSVLLVRPIAVRHRDQGPALQTGTAALVGKRATALSEVTDSGGIIKLAGEVWSARSSLAGVPIPEGHAVEVARIDGATAVVRDAEI